MGERIAIKIARKAHAGQVDKIGRPYIEHCQRVCARLINMWPLSTFDEIDAAWLHDVLEDTNMSTDDLISAGISEHTAYLVYSLTRPDSMSYLDWIRRIAEDGDQSVIRIKLADIADNSDSARAFPGSEQMVRTRYAPAREILLSALK